MRRTLGDREAHVLQRQLSGASALPALDELKHSLLEEARPQRAADEQHCIDGPTAQERRQMTADGGIGRVGEADLAQADRPTARHFRSRAERKEALDHQLLDSIPRYLGTERRAKQATGLAGDSDGKNLARRGAAFEDPLFERPGLGDELTPLLARDALFRPRLEQPLHQMRQGEVDVVAAEQQVVARRDPLDRRPCARRRERGDPEQAEIRRASADIQHEDALRAFGERRQATEKLTAGGCTAARRDPGIERRLGFLQEPELTRIAGQRGGLAGEGLGPFVERGRHGDDDALLDEGIARVLSREDGIPGELQMLQVGGARLDR